MIILLILQQGPSLQQGFFYLKCMFFVRENVKTIEFFIAMNGADIKGFIRNKLLSRGHIYF